MPVTAAEVAVAHNLGDVWHPPQAGELATSQLLTVVQVRSGRPPVRLANAVPPRVAAWQTDPPVVDSDS